MLPLPRLAAVISLLAFVILAERLSHRDPAYARWSWYALAAIVLGGRVGHVLANLPAFRTEPWTVLYLWQGGFSFVGAALAVTALTALYFRQRRPLLKSALIPLVAAGGLWIAFAGVLQLLHRPAPPLPTQALQRIDGETVRLTSLQGRPLVVNLWATWCAPCRREMPLLKEMAAEHPQARFLLVNQGEPSERVTAYLKAIGLDGDLVLLDADSGLAGYYQAPGYPMTLVYDAEGREVDRHLGELSRAILEAALRRSER